MAAVNKRSSNKERGENMIHYYTITQQGIEDSHAGRADWISAVDLSEEEREILSNETGLAEEYFMLELLHFTTSYYKMICSDKKVEYTLLELNHFREKDNSSVEDRLNKILVLTSSEQIITITNKSNENLYELFKKIKEPFYSYTYIGKYIIYLHEKYIAQMHKGKQEMDEIHSQARSSKKGKLLEDLTDIEQDFLYLSYVMENGGPVLKTWLTEVSERQRHMDVKLAHEIELKVDAAKTMVELYKELQEATSDLISSMIDNRLNNIMEQLTSISIVIAIPTLIYSLFGINTGGLWGVNSSSGSLIVVLISILLAVVTYYYLRKKDFLE